MLLRGRVVLLQTLCFVSSCIADLCNWSGSGSPREPLSGAVQQVHLRCSAGSVRWFSPTHALRVVLEPNLSSARPAAACVKPLRAFRGAALYAARAGGLALLLGDGERPERVRCFHADGTQRLALFLQASPQSDVTRRVVGFRYELLRQKSSPLTTQAVCGPCNDTEILQAICSSDFVLRASIRNVTHDLERQMSVVEVEEGRVYRQRSGVFERDPARSGHWHGHIHTLLQCHVKAGPGEFLFTGAEHFGEAWIGCAPRFKDFQALHRSASVAKRIPCDFPLN